jgi:site-specific recombinase XerD
MNRTQALLEAYASTVLTREVKASSKAAYRRRLALLARLATFGARGAGSRAPTVETCGAWVAWLSEHYAPETVKQTLTLAKGFWQYCLELGVVKGKNPFLTGFVKNINNLPPPPPAQIMSTTTAPM